ncbi:uncharacterized protein LACBIDRAFT_332233 [Laccaria bicolor S238N-H82]|uniref:Predicted protein n=1 Tax=Laccaria bicolor (strain S238N-H82 / ATCC MYA-4686) TaxID=486041 RepID=B0DS12_LACBS|nr:uncharacterized protein LACBIDRAFT_332227 [Laccaria bicolor S238N-H82]XP_001886755.1 uncharacterized protein LACBIDRAFT_332233 [Laccaria bicolor S238N-H82]EDR02707.1 predicted protein [Laccaria bicolor S238N-H82]EDR02711.1 predicted protein [Laccaria bicolor S238N-H82]|eukprot:XP_001886751.1 predicted protein [Laccaria bicolor S238N-H82]
MDSISPLTWLIPLAIIIAIRWFTLELVPSHSSKSDISTRQIRHPREGNRTQKPHLKLKEVRERQRLKTLYHRHGFGLLPTEIVDYIFTFCLPQSPFIRPKPTDAPLLLCHVSPAWRDYVTHNPKMWPSLIHPELMRKWLSCSSTLPISIHLSAGKQYYQKPEGREAFRTIAQTLAGEINRCNNLELDLPTTEATDVFLALLPQDEVLFLESFLIRCEEERRLPIHLSALFNYSPDLRKLIWKGPNVKARRFLPIVNWNQLVDVRLDCRLSLIDCFHIIQRSVQLKTCYLYGISIPLFSTLLTGPHTHTSLQDLRLHSTIPINSLISTLTLPSLNALQLILSGNPIGLDSHNSGADLSHFVERSSPPLRSLMLENFRIPENDLIQCLLDLPTIEEIKIDETAAGFLTNEFLDALGKLWPNSEDEGAHRMFLCPKLQSIRLGPTISSADGVFAEMFRKRWDAAERGEVCRMKSVHVEFRNGAHVADEEVKQYRAEGLSFHFYSIP